MNAQLQSQRLQARIARPSGLSANLGASTAPRVLRGNPSVLKSFVTLPAKLVTQINAPRPEAPPAGDVAVWEFIGW